MFPVNAILNLLDFMFVYNVSRWDLLCDPILKENEYKLFSKFSREMCVRKKIKSLFLKRSWEFFGR